MLVSLVPIMLSDVLDLEFAVAFTMALVPVLVLAFVFAIRGGGDGT